MTPRRRRPFGPLAVSLAAHVGLGVLLAAVPPGNGSQRRAVEIDILRPARPALAAPPIPDPPAEPVRSEPRALRAPRPEVSPIVTPVAPPPDAPPPPEEPPQFDMSNDSFALNGDGAFALAESHGTSTIGAYGRGDPNARGPVPAVAGRGPPSFDPATADSIRSAPEVVEEVLAEYPDAARRAGVEGVVRLMVEVRRDGTVRSARALNDPGYGMADQAVQALRRFRFSPAIDRQGRAVDYRLVFSYRFELDS